MSTNQILNIFLSEWQPYVCYIKMMKLCFIALSVERLDVNKCFFNKHSKHECIGVDEANEMFASKITQTLGAIKVIKGVYESRFLRTVDLKNQIKDHLNKTQADINNVINNAKL